MKIVESTDHRDALQNLTKEFESFMKYSNDLEDQDLRIIENNEVIIKSNEKSAPSQEFNDRDTKVSTTTMSPPNDNETRLNISEGQVESKTEVIETSKQNNLLCSKPVEASISREVTPDYIPTTVREKFHRVKVEENIVVEISKPVEALPQAEKRKLRQPPMIASENIETAITTREDALAPARPPVEERKLHQPSIIVRENIVTENSTHVEALKPAEERNFNQPPIIVRKNIEAAVTTGVESSPPAKEMMARENIVKAITTREEALAPARPVEEINSRKPPMVVHETTVTENTTRDRVVPTIEERNSRQHPMMVRENIEARITTHVDVLPPAEETFLRKPPMMVREHTPVPRARTESDIRGIEDSETSPKVPARRRSVKDIIESINRSQKLLKINHDAVEDKPEKPIVPSKENVLLKLHRQSENEKKINALLDDLQNFTKQNSSAVKIQGFPNSKADTEKDFQTESKLGEADYNNNNN